MIKYNGLKITRPINIELYYKEIKNSQKLYILKVFKKLRSWGKNAYQLFESEFVYSAVFYTDY